MNPRKRNLTILGVVLLALVMALLVVIPGSPLSKKTRLGLDLKGGVELIYEGRPTPKVPKVTPQAISDAIETIRKRTDALGVSEPEIQRAGANQISIGLPAVKNAARAEQQVGTTAQLQFYDWEPNLLPPNQAQPTLSLFTAVQTASKQKPRAEAVDIPPGGASDAIKKQFGNDEKKIEGYYDRQNDTAGDKYFLFGPGNGVARRLLRPGQVGEAAGAAAQQAATNDATAFYESCKEISDDYQGTGGTRAARGTSSGKAAKGTACPATLASLGDKGVGPPAGSLVIKVPRGIVVVKDEQRGKSKQTLGYWILEDDSELSGSDIKDPKQTFDPQTNEPVVAFDFTDKGRATFARATKREADRGAQILRPPGSDIRDTFQKFAITLDNQVVSLATIDYQQNPEGIPGDTGAQINGIGDIQQTQDLAQNLRIGALPIALKLISKTQVSATLGKQALNQGLVAGGVGILLTLLFLLLFYRVLGVVAGVALVMYAVLLFALVKLIPITLTLPGIAGLILTLGVAADANIVIFERVKEEARAGRSIPAAISSGYAKALRTIIDANVVTLGVAFILFMLATAGVKGFAFTLLIGTLVSLFTAVLATQAMLGTMARTRILRGRMALRVSQGERVHRFDFMGNSKWFFSMSGLILVAGALAIAGLGIKFGIDFESGTRITTPVQKSASVEQVRGALRPLGYGDAKIQQVNDPELGPNVVQISTRKLEPNRVNAVQQALDKDFGVQRADFSSSSVGPTFGQEIARTAIIAIIASLVLISIYIGLRFEFKFAVPVLIALMHDLLITSGVYALSQREVTTSTVAALLTILGFSLYDTIIVFDRIRENVPRMPRATFAQIVNRSMSEVITRSLVTSLSTLLPIMALMLFGGETLRDFGFALLIGVASGTYSSIFIAAPVLTHWKERETVWRRRERIVLEDHGGVIPAYADSALGDEPSRPARRQRATARAEAEPEAEPSTAAATAAPATAVEEPPAEAAPARPAQPAPAMAPRPRTPEARREARRAARAAAQAADGETTAGPTEAVGDGIHASDGAKKKPKRTGGKKKHGRSR
ncbi:MAG: SecD/SecF fusion protein [Thermoleophilaceae bacterium]|nr:SecD/SecF fusion protein [Thermoleophilaceae bacterium]